MLLLLLTSTVMPARVYPGDEKTDLTADAYKKVYEELYKTFLKNPEDPELNYQLGRAAYGFGDYEAAVMAFERVIIIDPVRTAARIELARSFLKLGALDTARQHCLDMLRSNPPPDLRNSIETLLRNIP